MQHRKNIFLTKTLFIIVLGWALLHPSFSYAQWPEVMSSAWDDSFREWQVYGEGEEQIGFIKMQYEFNDDWTEWMYQIGDESGFIRNKFKDNPNLWELRGGNLVYNARTQWPNDPLTWLISGEGVRMTLKSKYTNILEEWSATDSNVGDFMMYTFYENDPRDWETRENLNNDKLHLKVFLMFLVVINSAPRQ
ncbi:MAG: hypothetical protein IPI60_11340 [Saprospiraceae bacterium]|nr:hypothetical protein [Saprospiraceae bacterium]